MLCGTAVWYGCVVMLCGTAVWYCFPFTAVWYYTAVCMVLMCGFAVWYSCVVLLCGTTVWYCVVLLCGTDVWFCCVVCTPVWYFRIFYTTITVVTSVVVCPVVMIMWYTPLCNIEGVVISCGSNMWYCSVVTSVWHCPVVTMMWYCSGTCSTYTCRVVTWACSNCSVVTSLWYSSALPCGNKCLPSFAYISLNMQKLLITVYLLNSSLFLA